MPLVISLSNQICKWLKIDVNRMTDAEGNNPGVQTIQSTSMSSSWQFQVIDLNTSQWRKFSTRPYLTIAVESYSRYTLMKTYDLRPDFDSFLQDFCEIWASHCLKWFEAGGFVRTDQQMKHAMTLFFDFNKDSPLCYRNLDRSLGGNIADHQQWLYSFLERQPKRLFDDIAAEQLADHINQVPKTIKRRGKKEIIMPVERFLDDSLFRFAQGLCNSPIQDCQMGDFPNPYHQKPQLSIVKN